MKNKLNALYNDVFYKQHIGGMSKSAEIVLGFLYQFYKPESVVDVGCGQGAWLAAAESFGAKTLKGFDGEWVDKNAMKSMNIDFTSINFDQTLPTISETYDLCISLEVAEHLSEINASRFIDFLCGSSNTVLFGAAIKYQGGTNHINEQWQSYWIELFKARGYECIDIIRGNLWDNTSVEWWYRQNTFLFINQKSTLRATELKEKIKPIINVVHPEHYEYKINTNNKTIYNPTLTSCLRCMYRYLRNKMRGNK